MNRIRVSIMIQKEQTHVIEISATHDALVTDYTVSGGGNCFQLPAVDRRNSTIMDVVILALSALRDRDAAGLLKREGERK